MLRQRVYGLVAQIQNCYAAVIENGSWAGSWSSIGLGGRSSIVSIFSDLVRLEKRSSARLIVFIGVFYDVYGAFFF